MAVVVRKLELVGEGLVRTETDAQSPWRLRVAIASENGRALDAHFGYARRLMVYEVTERSHRLVQVVSCPQPESDAPPSESEDRIGAKLAALAGCDLLFALAIGPPAAAKAIQANIYPIKIGAPEGIEAVIGRVQSLMSGEPPRWLQKTRRTPAGAIASRKEKSNP